VADAPSEPIISHDYRLLFATLRVHNASPPLLLITEKNVDFALHWATEHYCQDVKVRYSFLLFLLIRFFF
jgi:hypothetical protein